MTIEIEKFWLNYTLHIFRFEKDSEKPNLVAQTWIDQISWVDREETTLVLCGAMPIARELIKLQDGDTLAIVHREFGLADEFDPNLVVVRFGNCKVRRKWFEDILRVYREDTVDLHVMLKCQMSFWF